ncbi:MAG TPA: single-stranded DNA-binding protein [Candidatus Saccharimonadales bacterium]|nr:single-stranded DNA-binding protein [Candidatus Saccharimonadales bacterium]
MARSLNRVQLIGNLTRDPELRYTPNGNGVCTFGIATNRSWTTDSGEKREEVDFHRIVAWNKLAELCSQFLTKGRKVYVEGRLSTRNWTGQDGAQKSTTEVVIDDMILLDNRQSGSSQQASRSDEDQEPEEEHVEVAAKPTHSAGSGRARVAKKEENEEGDSAQESQAGASDEEVAPDDIPF